MPVQAPISQMSLDELRHSLLLQVRDLREWEDRNLMTEKVLHPEHDRDKIRSLTRNLLVMHNNMIETVERIEELEERDGPTPQAV